MPSDSELLNATKKLMSRMTNLDASIIDLIAALNAMSSKSVTPLGIADVVTGYAVKFGMEKFGDTDSWGLGAFAGEAIAYDGLEWFYSISGNNIYRAKPGGSRSTLAVSGYVLGSVAYDRSNNYIHVGQAYTDTYGNTVDARLETYDDAGNLIYSVQITNPVMPPSELNIKALAYDNDNNKLYVLYHGPTYDIVRYGEVDPSTGVISNYVNINEIYAYVVSDMDIYNNVLYMNDPQTGVGRVYGFTIGEATTKFLAAFPEPLPGVLAPTYSGFAIDPVTLTWYLNAASSYLRYGAFVHIQRILNFDEAMVVSATAWPLPAGAATSANQTSMITALQLIDDLRNALKTVNTDQLVVEQEAAPSIADGNVTADDTRVEIVATRASRRGLIIQNADTVDTVWIGDVGVTTATGIELLPKQTLPLNNYTGATASIYGICSAGKTADVRVLEVF